MSHGSVGIVQKSEFEVRPNLGCKTFKTSKKWFWTICLYLLYYQWQKYCSLSYVSNLSNLKTERDTKKKPNRSIDRANICRIRLVLTCCISFRFKVMTVRVSHLSRQPTRSRTWWCGWLPILHGVAISCIHVGTKLFASYFNVNQ